MEQAIAAPLAAWESFYVIIGSASAALIGLQFVVIVLSAEMAGQRSESATGAFASPTIVHFSAVLFISAILSAPWSALTSAAITLGACGAAGFVYTMLVIRRALRQKDYAPVLEDWIWHGALPLIAYATLLVAAIFLDRQLTPALFAVSGAALLLLFIGIHNAWDSAIYIAARRRRQPGQRRN
jgi:hypothetical protein